MNAIDIETVRLKLFDLQGLLAFTHEAVHRTTTCLEYDSREGLATILRECKELTQAALEELAKSKIEPHSATDEKIQLIFLVLEMALEVGNTVGIKKALTGKLARKGLIFNGGQ